MKDKHYPWYDETTVGLTIFPDQEKKSLESLLFEYAHGEEGDECLDEPFEGAGYCVCPVHQVLAPIAAEFERQYQLLTAENEVLLHENLDLISNCAKLRQTVQDLTAELEKATAERDKAFENGRYAERRVGIGELEY